MWRIAVLDDEQEYVDIICEITDKYMAQHKISYEIHAYTSAKDLLKD